ncbi:MULTISPECIES: hypothetical protein [Mycolicibacterium]|jgi:type II secretory pathway component PulM|uniref:hypothetical protein n=1 Tax=Mycolicibacterium TaxID=1866885 RepID=UPI000AC35534|nr:MULTISPECIES: hypothetical protein [Mycolicibacterium]MCX8555528.1 hypothetical protein [Mycolicibacterium mucogenicum]GCB00633.1 hypothetical protein NCCNTM_42670 [Mycolicibacterium sp. NCC-Tsukiji]
MTEENGVDTQPGKTQVTLKPVFAFEQVFRYVDQHGAQQWLVVGEALNGTLAT